MNKPLISIFLIVSLSLVLRAQNPAPTTSPAVPAQVTPPSATISSQTATTKTNQTAQPPEVQGQAVPATSPGTPGAPTLQVNPAPTVSMPVPDTSDPLLEGFLEDLQYNPTDKRDPFLPYFVSPKQRLGQEQTTPLEPLQKFALSELKIVGIIWDVGHPKALIEDPKGTSHIIIENSKIGKDSGYVAAIREGEVIVVEPIQDNDGKKGYQTKILKLTKPI